ncbi:MAG TPA: SGNH/GDSL hydrolase family protein [Planctomycetota bacterium]|nr:SGNH/GDSL hydrolase family protein [Planctomycetota bacterium]
MPATAMRPRRSRVGLVFFLCVLALAAWEVVGRVAAPGVVTPLEFVSAAWAVARGGSVAGAGAPSDEEMAKMAFRPLPYLNYGFKPDWTRPPVKTRTREAHTNSLGYRGPEVQQPKPAGRYRIICLGGSTTYDDGVNDDETYPLRLQQFLREARPDRDIEVINAGVNSYTTAENLANLSLRLLDLQPDAIVLYEGINDWRPRTYPDFDSAYFHYRKVWDGSARHYEAGPPGTEMAGGINPFIQYNSPPGQDTAANARAAGPAAFERNLVSMAGIAKEHGVAVVMVSNTIDEANPYLREDASFLPGIREHNEVIRKVCSEHGALFVDLDAKFPKGADVPEGGLFVDIVHNNPRGSEIKARIIADGILAGLLP